MTECDRDVTRVSSDTGRSDDERNLSCVSLCHNSQEILIGAHTADLMNVSCPFLEICEFRTLIAV